MSYRAFRLGEIHFQATCRGLRHAHLRAAKARQQQQNSDNRPCIIRPSPDFSPWPYETGFRSTATRRRFCPPRFVAANHQPLTSQRLKSGSELPHSENCRPPCRPPLTRRCDGKNDVRGILAIVVDGLFSFLQLCVFSKFVARVRVAVVHGKVAAGNLHLDLVALLENVA